jgi:hypothetical protein
MDGRLRLETAGNIQSQSMYALRVIYMQGVTTGLQGRLQRLQLSLRLLRKTGFSIEAMADRLVETGGGLVRFGTDVRFQVGPEFTVHTNGFLCSTRIGQEPHEAPLGFFLGGVDPDNASVAPPCLAVFMLVEQELPQTIHQLKVFFPEG